MVFADAKIEVERAENQITPPAEEEGWTYLSAIDWVEATHGDTDKNKTVQKNKPFSPGNNGRSNKIALRMSAGNYKEFEKGLGTVAGPGNVPAVITYDLRGAEVSEFSTYLGIDRSATYGPQSARDVKVEVVVDNQVLYTTAHDYPNGLDYNTDAVKVTVNIPATAQKFELKAYAGEKQWSDELCFADAKFKATGTFRTPEDEGFGEFEDTSDTWQPQPGPSNEVLLPYVPEAPIASDTTEIADEEIALSAPQEEMFKVLTANVKESADLELIRKFIQQKTDAKELLNKISENALEQMAQEVSKQFHDEKAQNWYAKEDS